MSQLVIDIKNESLVQKVVKLLEVFKSDGVEIKKISTSEEQQWTDEYIDKHWKEIGMATHSADLDDDERLYEACAEFYNDKYSS